MTGRKTRCRESHPGRARGTAVRGGRTERTAPTVSASATLYAARRPSVATDRSGGGYASRSCNVTRRASGANASSPRFKSTTSFQSIVAAATTRRTFKGCVACITNGSQRERTPRGSDVRRHDPPGGYERVKGPWEYPAWGSGPAPAGLPIGGSHSAFPATPRFSTAAGPENGAKEAETGPNRRALIAENARGGPPRWT